MQNALDYDWLVVKVGGNNSKGLIGIERAISVALLEFYGNEFGDTGPTWEQASTTLKDVSRSARDLALKVETLDQRSRIAFSLAYNRLAESGEHSFSGTQLDESADLFLQHLSDRTEARIVDAISVLAEAVEQLELPTEMRSRGPKPKQTVKRLIECVADIIEEHSDREPLDGFYFNAVDERYEGPIVEILEHILGNFAPELRTTNSAIGGQIRRTIGDLSR